MEAMDITEELDTTKRILEKERDNLWWVEEDTRVNASNAEQNDPQDFSGSPRKIIHRVFRSIVATKDFLLDSNYIETVLGVVHSSELKNGFLIIVEWVE